MRSMSCCNSPARSKYFRIIFEKLDTKRENRDIVQEECEDLYAGAGNCTGCPIPDTCLVNKLETGLNIATIVLAILGAEQQLYSAHHFCFPSSGLLGNFVSVYVLSRSDCTRFGNLLIMLAYMDIRWFGRELGRGYEYLKTLNFLKKA